MDFFANVFNNNNRRSRNSDRNQRSGGNEQQRRSTPRPSSTNTGSSSSSTNTNTNTTNQGRSQPRPAGGGGRQQQQNNMFHGLGGLGGHGMDDFLSAAMASMTGHGGPPTQQQQQGPPPGQGGAPPASTKAIRQLPRVLVSSEDLVDENNRECCICFEEHKIGDKVTRLPCAHIFHTECITEWLTKHCTCPICRYELPTDDDNFEKGRKVRMASRKPRYAKYELERLSNKELLDLCKRLNISNVNHDLFMGSEKSEVIQVILESGKIDVIVAPEPVEYDNVQTLRNMGVGKLKKAMAEAGVFFDAKDVVEKEDMVKIFLNSGRIVLLEPISEVDEGGISDSGYEHIVVEDPYPTYKFSEDDEIEHSESKHGSSSNDDLNNESSYKFSEDDEIENSEFKRGSSNDLNGEHSSDSSDESESKRARMAPSTNTTAMDDTSTNSNNINMYDNDDTPVYQASSFSRTSIKSLRELANELEVDISDCIEKREMIERIVEAISRRPR